MDVTESIYFLFMQMVKVKATTDVRIRVNGVKEDLEEGTVVDAKQEEVTFYLMNGFVRVEDELGVGEMQTTDASSEDIVKKRGRKPTK